MEEALINAERLLSDGFRDRLERTATSYNFTYSCFSLITNRAISGFETVLSLRSLCPEFKRFTFMRASFMERVRSSYRSVILTVAVFGPATTGEP